MAHDWRVPKILLESFFVRPELLPIVSFIPSVQDRINKSSTSCILVPSSLVFLCRSTRHTRCRAMTIWIDILEWIIIGVCIPVKALGIPRIGHEGIAPKGHPDKARQPRIVPTRAVVVQPNPGFLALAGEFVAVEGLTDE